MILNKFEMMRTFITPLRRFVYFAALCGVSSTGLAARSGCWRDAFESSPVSYGPIDPNALPLLATAFHVPLPLLEKQLTPFSGTFRIRVPITARGHAVRIRFSNESGDRPLAIAAASIGIATKDSSTAALVRPLMFGGVRSITMASGTPALSDAVDLEVTPTTELIVSYYSPTPITLDPRGYASIEFAPGDQTLKASLPNASGVIGRPVVSGAMVLASDKTRVIAAFGDSTTDGNRLSNSDLKGWPQQLARRLASRRRGPPFSVVNAGIGGNRILADGAGVSGLGRLDRDVLRMQGLAYLIILEGIDDIGFSAVSTSGSPVITASEIIAGYRQIISRAHVRGVKVGIGTITPLNGAVFSSAEKEKIRLTVNHWIRSSGEPDFVVDFERVLRAPGVDVRLRKDFDSGDHLHPNEAGYRAMGNAIDLDVFR